MGHRCLTDISGPFYDPAKPFRNWSTFPFYQIDRADWPYVDHTHLAWGIERAIAYLERVYSQGYTGIVIDNLAHLVSFDMAPIALYAPTSPYRVRAQCYREAFRTLFQAAAHMGMEVFVTTDMQWSTPPLYPYIGRLIAQNPRLAEINRWAVEELFTMSSHINGIVVRVGEAGGAYNHTMGYHGHMLYTTPHTVRILIDSLLPLCEQYQRLLIIRTWSIGIGKLGDFMWSKERYQSVFDGYDSPWLMVSMKHGPSDFFRFLPHNPTSGMPGPAQIIELQNRREYELFGMVPTAVIPLHQDIIHHETHTNRHFAGLWAWNSSGGWGGGRAALGTDGWSIWTELSSAITAALAHNPDMDTHAFVYRWCEATLGQHFGSAVANVYIESSTIIEQGWYLGKLTNGDEAVGTLYLPSLLWVWWMRPTASLIMWAYLALAVEDCDTVLRASANACSRLAWHVQQLAARVPTACSRAAAIVESISYLHDSVVVAKAIRVLMLQALNAAWHANHEQWNDVATHIPDVQATLQQHCARWSQHPTLPPLELEEFQAFLHTFQRTPGRIWFQARGACILVKRLHTQQKCSYSTHARMIGLVAIVLVLLPLVAKKPRTTGVAGVILSMLLASPLRQRTLHALLPWMSRQLYLLPTIFFEAGPSLSEWTAASPSKRYT